ncbi:uncharacterized protein LOC120435199 [Oreochromis aureus]|uniref:uncharacterized protein LOC120435199 n=1 Tax=Oreochromis aureus TaxID=47969 RepID=UPI0019535FCC|nr:uncharacterized protein LOC120435199 [Oreochromis aureus]
MEFKLEDFTLGPTEEKLDRCKKDDLILIANFFDVTVPLNAKKKELKELLCIELHERGLFGKPGPTEGVELGAVAGIPAPLKNLPPQPGPSAEELQLTLRIKEVELKKQQLEVEAMHLRVRALEIERGASVSASPPTPRSAPQSPSPQPALMCTTLAKECMVSLLQCNLVGKAQEAKFSGPYVVERKLSETDYVVLTPDRKKKSRVCHINMLKEYVGRERSGLSPAVSPIVNHRNPKRASCEEVAKIIVNRYPQTFADFTEKGERLGCGHYSLPRSIKSRVEHVNQDNTTHRLRQTKRTRNEEDCSPNSNATPPKIVRCLVDSYGCINWQPVELPERETPASLEEKKHIMLRIFNSEGPGAVERPDVDDIMCLTYISQRQLINSCPSLSVAEIQEQWPFLFTLKGLSNHFYKLTGIYISERLGQALITKGRRIINYFSSQKLKWNLGIRTLIQQIESEGVLTNNKVGTAAILLMMKYYKEDKDSLFVLAGETSTRMSLEAESNLPSTPRLIMLGQSSMTATCWMVSAEGRVIVELDKENTFADAMSAFFGSFYVLNLEYQESVCATLELIQRFVVRINPEEGTKCTSKVGTSRKTGTTVKRKVVHINPHVTTFLQRLTEFEWRTSN